jgi:hypothetical protein
MMTWLKKIDSGIDSKLRERGITVKQDRFPGYDDKNY